ncbi:MAG: CBS domain-containing protein [Deltaproteobacteria bacterium]|nr:CBS domain-containing protein [Candidatus Anaeroferrophillus wilburensis]MBN2888840.1 CBS domain-containing protein [Deltaproteobacteria bacterium]
MFVRNWMKKDPVTVTSDTLVIDAKKIMKENKFRRLPVVDRGKLVGIVTLNTLREAQPSAATSLSIHELHYLLAKMTVADIMTKKIITCSPDITLEKAARMGTRHGIGALPVVENGKLVGIITESDIYRAFLTMLGAFKVPSTRISIDNFPQDQDAIIKVISILDELKLTLCSLAVVDDVPVEGRRQLIFRVCEEDISALKAKLATAGFPIADATPVEKV